MLTSSTERINVPSHSIAMRPQVIVSPLVRLTNASNPPLEDVGTPEGILNSLGSYITYVPNVKLRISNICFVQWPPAVVTVSSKRFLLQKCQRLQCTRSGTYLDEEDVRKTDKKSYNGRSYYQYEAYAPYGSLGPHTLSSVTVKVWHMSCYRGKNFCWRYEKY